ncbi:GNAT family N-acetyltransferase [Acinetobacter sp. ANC 4169]|uniref:GNAT family N-acetyltransferase n=1 Tax=Acinetobacter sp. ANC 4169 TaxID=1977879 RepID=UPI000A35303B|nr:GNAT family N-acetyltransferase [Acinetobacter sp. ANC 4169]OTG76076.1 GNAT family N-acetyltransferase [Acinetobacter sp. ANC 4169]
MIRIAELSDSVDIQQLIQPYISDFAIHAEGEQKFSQFALEQLLQQTEVHYFVYERASKIMGVIAYREPAYLVHFFVDQADQGQGIGRLLWNYLLQSLEDGNPQQVSVNSSCNAVAVYEKFGFQCISDVCEFGGLRFIKMLRLKSSCA